MNEWDPDDLQLPPIQPADPPEKLENQVGSVYGFMRHVHGIQPVSLDTNYDPAEQWDGGLDAALQHTDIFLPNEAELRAITARDHPEPQDAETGSVILAGRIPTLAVKLGQQGAIAHCQGHTERAQALAVEVKDTTGAGDTFDAGFIFGQLKGWSLRRSLQLAQTAPSVTRSH